LTKEERLKKNTVEFKLKITEEMQLKIVSHHQAILGRWILSSSESI